LDLGRWNNLWERLGARGNGRRIFDCLVAAYAEPTRAYHTAEHIENCLTLLDDSRVLALYPDEVEAAIWFHDAVYVAGNTDNESRSAELARASLRDAHVAPDVAERISAMVLETRHVARSSQQDAALLCDIDLAILGWPPEAFDLFERRIRQEYATVPEAIYRRRRSEILRGFLGRASIFQTAWFRRRLEAPARANLERALVKLDTG
jgi:predicted metal-dependent HD superfamily phosphohydrolase